MGDLRVELLGDPRAWLGADQVALGPARQRAVFSVLASQAGQLVRRRDLIEGVWGTSPPASAEGSVHTYVSGLRRVLEPDRPRWSPGTVLVSEPDGYRLRLPAEHLDLHAFQTLQPRAETLARGGEHRAAVEQLDAALALWRGEAFAGVPGPFAERHRARLAEQRQAAVEQRVRSRLELGEHAELVVELVDMVGEQPLREPAWALLVTALHRSGRHAEALDVIARLRAHFRRELGTDPGPAIRRLHEQLLADTPEQAVPVPRDQMREGGLVFPASAGPAGSAESLPPKDADVARLRGYLDAALAGRGRAVLVEGELGTEKTELLTAALTGGGEPGRHVAWAVADRRRPFLRVVGGALGAEPADATRNGLLARVDALCATAPLVLVVEDLHLADDAGLVLWHQLTAATRLLPLLLVATAAPAERRSTFAMLRHGVLARDGEVIRLGATG
jgi:DNA-binding SARP family transcriptional activator